MKASTSRKIKFIGFLIVCGVLFYIFNPQIMSFIQENFGSKDSIRKTADKIGKNVGDANDAVGKNLKKAGDGIGKGIDSLRQ